MAKLNKAGIKYIAEVFEDFENHADSVVCAALDNNRVYMDLDSLLFGDETVVLGYEESFYGDSNRDSIAVSMEDFLSIDYEATRRKYIALRQAEEKRKEAETRAMNVRAMADKMKKEMEDAAIKEKEERDMLAFLMSKYPNIKV